MSVPPEPRAPEASALRRGLSRIAPALRGAGWSLRAVLELGLLAVGPSLLLLTDYFAYGAGLQRFLVLLGLFAFVLVATSRWLRLRSAFSGTAGHALLGLAVLGSIWLAGTQFWRDARSGEACWTDMGRPSVCAGELLLAGFNPWSECVPRKPKLAAPSASMKWCLKVGGCVDWRGQGKQWAHLAPGYRFMDGYKYGPLMALLYLPATHRLQEAGLIWVNLLFWCAALALVYALARAAFPHVRASGLRALLVFLLPAVLPANRLLERVEFSALGRDYVLERPPEAVFVRMLTFVCSNDLIPVCFALLACLCALRKRSLLAGVSLGLSLATKQLPGLLLALLLVRLRGVDARRFTLGVVGTALLCYVPFFLWGPREMIASLLLFNFVRPTNSSSIRRFLPAELEPLVSLAQLALAAWLIVRFMRAERRDGAALMRSACLLVIGFVMLNKIVHGNYLLWIQPLLALAVAGWPFVSDSRAPSVEPASSPPARPTDSA